MIHSLTTIPKTLAIALFASSFLSFVTVANAEQVRVDWSVDQFTNGAEGRLSGSLGVYPIIVGNELVQVEHAQTTFVGAGFADPALNTALVVQSGSVSLQFTSLTDVTLEPTPPADASQLNLVNGVASGAIGAFSSGFKFAIICRTDLCNILDPNDPDTFTGSILLTAEVVPDSPVVPMLGWVARLTLLLASGVLALTAMRKIAANS